MSVKSYTAAKTAASSATATATTTPAPATPAPATPAPAATTPAPATPAPATPTPAATTPAPATPAPATPAPAARPVPAATAAPAPSSEEEVVNRITASVLQHLRDEGDVKDLSDRVEHLEDENKNLKNENRSLWKAIGKFLEDHEESDWKVATGGAAYTTKGEPVLKECWPLEHNGTLHYIMKYEKARKAVNALSVEMPKVKVVWVDPKDDDKFYKELEFEEVEELDKRSRLDKFTFIDDPEDFDDED